jgi:hypothetical protein
MHLVEALTLAVILLGTGGAILIKRSSSRKGSAKVYLNDSKWARPGTNVTFRAELMPGRDTSERTFRVAQSLSNGRIILEGLTGEHSENEFEALP